MAEDKKPYSGLVGLELVQLMLLEEMKVRRSFFKLVKLVENVLSVKIDTITLSIQKPLFAGVFSNKLCSRPC